MTSLDTCVHHFNTRCIPIAINQFILQINEIFTDMKNSEMSFQMMLQLEFQIIFLVSKYNFVSCPYKIHKTKFVFILKIWEGGIV